MNILFEIADSTLMIIGAILVAILLGAFIIFKIVSNKTKVKPIDENERFDIDETNTKSEVALTEKQKKAKEELERVFNQMSSDLEKQEPTKDEIDEFERKQEENAIISYKQLMEEAKKLKEKADEYEQEADKVADMKIDDAINTYEKHSKINASEIETSKPQEAYQGFKNSDIISPIYGIQKEKKDKKITTKFKTNDIISKAYNEVDEEREENTQFLNSLKEFRKNL
ncbi:MAG: hypothetical protein PUA73_00880 [Bacilli bacterium]|nr:hypothetical protein [Bacilli bacterium]